MKTDKNIALPQHWKMVKVEDSCDLISLNKIKLKKKEYLRSGKYPVIDQGQEIIGGYFNDVTLIVPSEPPFIIFGDHTKVKKYVNFKFIAGADGVKVLKPIETFVPKLFYYFLYSIQIPDKGYARHFQFLNKAEIPLPPLPEQHRIVAKIEELFSELDNGIAQLKKVKEQLKLYRQSVLKWAFEGRLTNKDVKKGELPAGWKTVKVMDVAKVGTGATPLKSKSDYYNNGSIAWVTSGALNDDYVSVASDFVTEKALKETNLKIYPKHTLLIAMYGEGKTRGKCSELLIEATTNQAIAAISFGGFDHSLKPYLKLFLQKNYNDIRRLSSGGVQPNINLGIVKNIEFPICSKEEQNKIVQEIESRLSVADKLEETINQSLQQSEALRQSILKRAFEGKLVPQDPNDEHAEVLLERIKNEN